MGIFDTKTRCSLCNEMKANPNSTLDGLMICDECKPEYENLKDIELSTLQPTGSFSNLGPIVAFSASTDFNVSLKRNTLELRKLAYKLGGNKIVGMAYNHSSALDKAGNLLILVVSYGTAIK